ncbi:hypothetical protein JCM8547_005091 [Rhodosporidiobolus lusitaniae]
MIPSRPAPPPSAAPESVSARLHRLRAEQSSSSRPSFRISSPTASSNTPRWLEGALAPPAPPPPRRPYGRRGTAGPPPPPSWTARAVENDPAVAVDGRNRRGVWVQGVEKVERRKLATPLVSRGEEDGEEKAGPASLFTAAGRVVADDLARGAEGSMLLEHVAYLPNHLRLRLLDVFADWRTGTPLTPDGAVQLLRTDTSDGLELEDAGALLVPPRVEEEDDGWDVGEGEGTSLVSLTSLDFPFSSLSLRTLRSLLLHPADASSSTTSRPSTPSTPSPAHPASSATPSLPRPPKLLPTFPFLHTLNLTATPRIPFSDSFFDLLSLLLSLRSLSLCGKSLNSPSSSVTSATFLPRLAAATPTLVTLDLSWIDLAHVNVKAVDWDTRWLNLKVLGLRRELVDWQGEEAGAEQKERIKKEVWGFISQKRKKKRRWIEIIV